MLFFFIKKKAQKERERDFYHFSILKFHHNKLWQKFAKFNKKKNGPKKIASNSHTKKTLELHNLSFY